MRSRCGAPRISFGPRNGTYQRGSHTSADRETIIDVGLCVFGSLLRYVRRRKLLVVKDLMGAAGARRRYRRALRAFQPDCLLAFNPCGVLAPVLDDFAAYARRTGVPLNCYVSDHWLAGWPIGHPVGAGLMKCRRLLTNSLHGTVQTLEQLLRRWDGRRRRSRRWIAISFAVRSFKRSVTRTLALPRTNMSPIGVWPIFTTTPSPPNTSRLANL